MASSLVSGNSVSDLRRHLDVFLIYLGPGNCLGILAAKTGPTAVRGHYYGIAAAIGKVGAFVGTYCMWNMSKYI